MNGLGHTGGGRRLTAVRFWEQVIAESGTSYSGETRPFYDFLESCLRHKAEMVIFEAARAICALPDVTSRELTPAVTVLQLFLSSSKPVLRFAAVCRTSDLTNAIRSSREAFSAMSAWGFPPSPKRGCEDR